MRSTWTCEECGAVYEVTYTKLPVRDNDSADCQVCGHQFRPWNTTKMPSFRLVSRPGEPRRD
jgi:predicted Zn finger-like uncharacterized protein